LLKTGQVKRAVISFAESLSWNGSDVDERRGAK